MEIIVKQLIINYNFSKKYSENLINEFDKFMFLKNKYINVSPSNNVDKVWHTYILNTKLYRDYCLKNFGKFIDHDPEDANNQILREIRFKNTLSKYFTEYGYRPSLNYWNNSQNKYCKIIYLFDKVSEDNIERKDLDFSFQNSNETLNKLPKINSGLKYDNYVFLNNFSSEKDLINYISKLTGSNTGSITINNEEEMTKCYILEMSRFGFC